MNEIAKSCVLLLVLGVGVLFVQPWQSPVADTVVPRRPLKEVPARVGDWQKSGMDQRFDRDSERVLNSDDYILRDYEFNDATKVSLFVGYYEKLEFFSNWHSPTVCLPGSGWSLSQRSNLEIPAGNGTPSFAANAYLIQKGKEQLVMLYWFQGRGRFMADNFSNKFYSALDGLQRRRSDGAIVRLVVPINKTEAEAFITAKTFASQMAPLLSPHVPR